MDFVTAADDPGTGMLFTPRDAATDERLRMKISRDDYRGYRRAGRGIVTDLQTGVRYSVERAACGAECFCDAVAIPYLDSIRKTWGECSLQLKSEGFNHVDGNRFARIKAKGRGLDWATIIADADGNHRIERR